MAAGAKHYDFVVIGGGVNGCGVARDLVGRGASVALFEKSDLAEGTSSRSTKLIHGGLRYLEHYEFRLVREALIEREILWACAPHIIWPLRFVLPYHSGLRPAWMLRLGLFLYDHLGGRKLLPPTRTLDLGRHPTGAGLAPGFRKGFEYSDAWVDDARLVVLNALDAAERGAAIHVRTEVRRIDRVGEGWRIEAVGDKGPVVVSANNLINAAGPWVSEVLSRTGVDSPARVRLVKGSHIITRRLFAHDEAYIFQNRDGRVVFAIPYQQDFTLIGTTDQDYDGDPGQVAASADEIAYLCQALSEYLAETITPADVVATYAGVRPLFDDGSGRPQEATRDYVLKLDQSAGAPVLSVFGGKITTYRRLAEEAVGAFAGLHAAAARPAFTHKAPLPGGDFPVNGFEALKAEFGRRYPFLSPFSLHRLVRAYGVRLEAVLGSAKASSDLGQAFGVGLTEAEIDYLRRVEWARTADDILWRRTKLGLRFTAAETAELQAYLAGA